MKHTVIAMMALVFGIALTSCSKNTESLNVTENVMIKKAKFYTYAIPEQEGVIIKEAEHARVTMIDNDEYSGNYQFQYQSDSSFVGSDVVEIEVYNLKKSGKKCDVRTIHFNFDVRE